MKRRDGENGMKARQSSNITDDALRIGVKDRHQVIAQMRDVEPAATAIQALIVEARGGAAKLHIAQDAEWQLSRLNRQDGGKRHHEGYHDHAERFHHHSSHRTKFASSFM